MNWNCIIVEDNILERDSLALKLAKIDGLTLRASLEDGLEALNFLKKNEIDIVISDIDMPDLSGLGLIKSLNNPPVFILCSSFPEHAAESFELDVIDYIVKPVKLERLNKAVEKATHFLKSRNKYLQEAPQKPSPIPTQSIPSKWLELSTRKNTFLSKKIIPISNSIWAISYLLKAWVTFPKSVSLAENRT